MGALSMLAVQSRAKMVFALLPRGLTWTMLGYNCRLKYTVPLWPEPEF